MPWLISILALLPTAAVVLAVLYLKPYLGKKGENLATHEDAEKLTKAVESVRQVFAQDLEDRRATHQLRLACVEQRLAAHQKAYTLWLNAVRSIHNRAASITASADCQDWFDQNCLYLDAKARRAFLISFRLAAQHGMLLDAKAPAADIRKNWDEILNGGTAIEEAAGLPPLSQTDLDLRGPDAPPKSIS